MMTTGIFSRMASWTGRMSARSSSGARTMPSTPRLMKSSTTVICWARSSSFCGPFQMISTPSSRAARTAPAWIDFQNSWVVPLGMTAMLQGLRPGRAGRVGGLLGAGREGQRRAETHDQGLGREGSHGLSILRRNGTVKERQKKGGTAFGEGREGGPPSLPGTRSPAWSARSRALTSSSGWACRSWSSPGPCRRREPHRERRAARRGRSR